MQTEPNENFATNWPLNTESNDPKYAVNNMTPTPLRFKPKPRMGFPPVSHDSHLTSKTPSITPFTPPQGTITASPVTEVTMDSLSTDPVTPRARQLAPNESQPWIDSGRGNRPNLFPNKDSNSSITPVERIYYLRDKKAKVTCDGSNFTLAISNYEELERDGIDGSSTSAENIYDLQNMSIKVTSDGHSLTVVTTDHQKATMNVDTGFRGSAVEPLHPAINQRPQQDMKLLCYGSVSILTLLTSHIY
jgi:hypothetical protein